MGYPATMSFSPEELDLIDRAHEVEIETQAPEGAARTATIWAVVDDGRVFIRTWKGAERTRWFRDIEANPAVALHVNGRRLTATAIPATDPDSVQRTSDGYRRKYGGDPATDAMVRPEVLDTTLRLEPA
jgi:hypothetical protein